MVFGRALGVCLRPQLANHSWLGGILGVRLGKNAVRCGETLVTHYSVARQLKRRDCRISTADTPITHGHVLAHGLRVCSDRAPF